ncbi:MAG TPA: hypothetical protein VNZ85_00810 [Caulobacter sp.]|nr:hypothetical protein [Caulobacter sp.]
MSAVLDGDIAGVERRLAVDKVLVATRGGPNGDRLNLAIARWRSSFATPSADHPGEARLRRSACNQAATLAL